MIGTRVYSKSSSKSCNSSITYKGVVIEEILVVRKIVVGIVGVKLVVVK